MLTSLRAQLARWISPATSQEYISHDLFHFVGRGRPEPDQYALLVKILQTGWLLHEPFDPRRTGNMVVRHGSPISSNDMYNPQVVCFCDIPISQLQIHCGKYSRFGVGFAKRFVADRGARPVTYVPQDGGTPILRDPPILPIDSTALDPISEMFDWETTASYFDRQAPAASNLVRSAGGPGVTPLMHFLEWHILGYLKFFNSHLADDHPDNFYFEREWRMTTHLRFSAGNVSRIVIPRTYRSAFKRDFPALWGLVTYVR